MLLKAVIANNIPIVKLLLKKGCNINTGFHGDSSYEGDPIKYENTLVFKAAARGYSNMVNFLISEKAPVKQGARFYKDFAKQRKEQFEQYKKKIDRDFGTVERKKGPISDKRGLFKETFTTTYPVLDYYKQEVQIYVPDEYTEDNPHGLIVYIHGGPAKPSKSYRKVLSDTDMIWIGFNSYYDKGSQTEQQAGVALAAVYNMLQQFNIDTDRVYVGGFSKGGLTAGPLLEWHPNIFKGSIVSCRLNDLMFEADINRIIGYGNHPVIMATGDLDFNLEEVYYSYIDNIKDGRKATYYFQESGRGHTILTSANFKKAIELLDKHNK